MIAGCCGMRRSLILVLCSIPFISGAPLSVPRARAATAARPPRRTPPATAQPVEHLTLGWQVADAPEPGSRWSLADADAEHVVVQRYEGGGTALGIAETTTGRIVARVQGWRGDMRDHTVAYDRLSRLARPDALITWHDANIVASIDPATGRERWSAALDSLLTLHAAQRAAGGLLPLTTGERGVVALDVDRGRARWSYDAEARGDLDSPADAQHAYFIVHGPAPAHVPFWKVPPAPLHEPHA